MFAKAKNGYRYCLMISLPRRKLWWWRWEASFYNYGFVAYLYSLRRSCLLPSYLRLAYQAYIEAFQILLWKCTLAISLPSCIYVSITHMQEWAWYTQEGLCHSPMHVIVHIPVLLCLAYCNSVQCKYYSVLQLAAIVWYNKALYEPNNQSEYILNAHARKRWKWTLQTCADWNNLV